jgi:hypothetical protein
MKTGLVEASGAFLEARGTGKNSGWFELPSHDPTVFSSFFQFSQIPGCAVTKRVTTAIDSGW